MRRFLLYLVRWQLSTPILWLVLHQLGIGAWQAVLANLIGGSIFFWIDKYIFTNHAIEMWHIKEGTCDACGKTGHLWRLVKAPGYDKRKDTPVFLCMECSKHKTDSIRKSGIKILGKSK